MSNLNLPSRLQPPIADNPRQTPCELQLENNAYLNMVEQARPKSIQSWRSRARQFFSYFTGFFKGKPIELYTTKGIHLRNTNQNFLESLSVYSKNEGIDKHEAMAIADKYITKGRPLTSYAVLRINADIRRKIIDRKIEDALSFNISRMGIENPDKETIEKIKKDVYKAINDDLNREAMRNMAGQVKKNPSSRLPEISPSSAWPQSRIENLVFNKILERYEGLFYLKSRIETEHEQTSKSFEDDIKKTLTEGRIKNEGLIPNSDFICEQFFTDFHRGWNLIFNNRSVEITSVKVKEEEEITKAMKSLIPDNELRASLSIICNQAIEGPTAELTCLKEDILGPGKLIFISTTLVARQSTVSFDGNTVSIVIPYAILQSANQNSGLKPASIVSYPKKTVKYLDGTEQTEGIVMTFKREFKLSKGTDGKYTEVSDFKYHKPVFDWKVIKSKPKATSF